MFFPERFIFYTKQWTQIGVAIPLSPIEVATHTIIYCDCGKPDNKPSPIWFLIGYKVYLYGCDDLR